MAYPRSKQLPAFIPFDTAQNVRQIEIPRDGSASLVRFQLTGSYDLAAGTASGTVKSTPVSPFGLISRFALRRAPESFAGPLVLDNVSLLHLLAVAVLGRSPRKLAPVDGAAGNKPIFGEFVVPTSFLDAMETLLPVAGRTSWQAEVTWPNSVNNARDALYTGNDRTLSNNGTDPVRVEVLLDDVLGPLKKPWFEVAWRYDRKDALATGYNEKVLSVTPGERVPLVMMLLHNNSLRADMIGTPNDQLALVYGGADPVITRKGGQLATENDADYKVRDGDRSTGLYFFDELKRADSNLLAVPEVSSDGGIPKILINSGSTAWTGTAYAEFLSFVVRLTDAGRQAIASGELSMAA